MEFKRITTNPRQMGEFRVFAVFGSSRDCRCPRAEGQTTEGILGCTPDLEADDVREALLFAAEAVRERALPLAAGE